MSNSASPLPTHEQIVATFNAEPFLAAINYRVDGVDVRVEQSAIEADPRLGTIIERIERLVPFAAMYEEKVVID